MTTRLKDDEKRKNLPLSLNKKIYDMLEEISIEKDINKSKLIEKLIRDYLKEEKKLIRIK